MITIAYYSMTGKVEKFVNNLYYPHVLDITTESNIATPFILITPTVNFGEIPAPVQFFMKNNYKHCLGISGSGNKNWGSNYCNATNLLAKQYNIPIINKFELSGTEQDVIIFKNRLNIINKLVSSNATQDVLAFRKSK